MTCLALLAALCLSTAPDAPRLFVEQGELRVQDLDATAVENAAVLTPDEQRLPLSSEALRVDRGALVVTLPKGIDSGTLIVIVRGELRAFAFSPKETASARAEPAARAACRAIEGTWIGRLHGNDPDVRANLSVEVDGDCKTVHAILQWRSATSGKNDRVLQGHWDAQARALTASDVNLNGVAPSSGWRFCLIERYSLTLSADGSRLVGRYSSKACRDEATVELARPEAPAR